MSEFSIYPTDSLSPEFGSVNKINAFSKAIGIVSRNHEYMGILSAQCLVVKSTPFQALVDLYATSEYLHVVEAELLGLKDLGGAWRQRLSFVLVRLFDECCPWPDPHTADLGRGVTLAEGFLMLTEADGAVLRVQEVETGVRDRIFGSPGHGFIVDRENSDPIFLYLGTSY